MVQREASEGVGWWKGWAHVGYSEGSMDLDWSVGGGLVLSVFFH